MRVLFMGTPDFAEASLRALLAAGHEIAGVCCQPDKPQGRHFTLTPPPVKVLAREAGIPVFQPKTLRDPEVLRQLAGLAPEVIVVAAYGKILPREVLEIPPRGCLNVHGSLLPKYRGAAPIQWAVINDEPTAGVTIMRMEEGLDTGPMLLQRSLAVGKEETAGELFDRLALLGAQALTEALEKLDDLVPVPQDESLASWAPMLTKADGAVDWTRDAASVCARIRGVTPWPGAYTFLRGKRLKIHRARPADRRGEPGRPLPGEGLTVACGSGAVELLEVQPEGGRRMSAGEYARGLRLTDEDVFGA